MTMKKSSNEKGNKWHGDYGRFVSGPTNKSKTLIIKNNDGVNATVWNESIKKLDELQQELPQVSKLIKAYNGEGVVIRAESFNPDGVNHTEVLADGDMNPKTGIISINTNMRLSDKNDIDSIERACKKSGTFGKFGRALSSTSPLHTAVHEYGHVIHLALCCKYNSGKTGILGDYSTRDTVSDLISMACYRTNTSVSQFQHSLSAVASKDLSETFSEAIANAVCAPKENNKTSLELWKIVKEELG